jgi:hypothetical protein
MSWNYRVLKTADPDGTPVWAIHEVYYDEHGAVNGWTENSAWPSGETWDELHRDVAMYSRAFGLPPLDVTSGSAVELTITGRVKRTTKDRR